MFVPLWVNAGLVAFLASMFGMFLGRDKALSWRAWRPVLAVLTFDIAAGVGALPLVLLIYRQLTSTPTIWPAVIAGTCGPALLRARTPKSLRDKIGNWYFFGALRALQVKAENDIEKICVGAETSKLDATVAKLDVLSLSAVTDWAERYLVRARKRDTPTARGRNRKVELLHEIAADDAASELVRKKTLVQVLLDEEGYRAVRALVQHARSMAPKRLLARRWLPGRYSLDGLVRGLTLPDGYRVEVLEGRVRIGHPDRRVDGDLRALADRLRDELGTRALVEGVYEGWIVVRGASSRHRLKLTNKAISKLIDQLKICPACHNLVFQRDGMVLDPGSGLYASAALVVSPRDAPPCDDAYCPNAFNGNSVKLVSEVAFVGPAEDVRVYKYRTYALAQVLIYLLLDFERRRVTAHYDPVDGKYNSTVSADFGAPLSLPSPFNVDLNTAQLL